ncbi:MAG: hypothetical protein JWO48_2805 [Bryobacterales bacterium]|nr:hypothetical protein [Bryobacterales bacterium]
MRKARGHRNRSFFGHHSLSIAAVGILMIWIFLYARANPSTHLGSFFGNAVADWTGVLVTVIATKYFYEIGSAESRRPRGDNVRSHVRHIIRNHSLTIFLLLTEIGWIVLYIHMNSEAKWGQVVGNIVSEWTQLLGLVLLTKHLIEEKSKESKAR